MRKKSSKKQYNIKSAIKNIFKKNGNQHKGKIGQRVKNGVEKKKKEKTTKKEEEKKELEERTKKNILKQSTQEFKALCRNDRNVMNLKRILRHKFRETRTKDYLI
ncbi:hypothetical protein M8J75_003064 [Diaphorina citri]|nr:hypothetical protein M8J75_003064 [Diaphorina citri]KAI5734161.1 hypothetical protein M8J77_003289 [Diaphorina citri]